MSEATDAMDGGWTGPVEEGEDILKLTQKSAEVEIPSDHDDDDEAAVEGGTEQDASDEEEQCPICLEEIAEDIGRLQCNDLRGHEFCLICIKDWLQHDSRCPMCRKEAKKTLYIKRRFQARYSSQTREAEKRGRRRRGGGFTG